MIHQTAIISPKATIAKNVQIGPFCVIGDNVTIGADNVIHSNVVIQGKTTIGNGNEFFPFSTIGTIAQSYVDQPQSPSLVIGNNNIFRENTTVHCSTIANAPTCIGDNNLFLCYSHVAHDCQIGNHVILSHNSGISGFVVVEDHAIVSAMSGIHQFVRVGAYAFSGGLSKIVKDIPPFTIADGNPASLRGINTVGLRRKGFSNEDIGAIKEAYKILFLNKEITLNKAIEELNQLEIAQNQHVKHLVEFIQQKGANRGVTR